MKNLAEKIKLAHKANIPLALWGRHGVGKTATVEGLRNEGFYVKTLVLSQYDILTLGGYPYRDETEHGVVTRYAKPAWLVELEEAAERGQPSILFLDELNRAAKVVLAAALRIVNERHIGEHKLPDNCLPIVACNPSTETDRVTVLSDPLMDRFAHIRVEAHLPTWDEWAQKNSVSAALREWVIDSPASNFCPLDMDGLFEEQVLNRITPTPRSLAAVDRLIKALGDESALATNGAAQSIVIGLLGQTAALSLITHIQERQNRTVDAATILTNADAVISFIDQAVVDGRLAELVNALDTISEAVAQEVDQAVVNGDITDHWDGIKKRLDVDVELGEAVNNWAKVYAALPNDIALSVARRTQPWEFFVLARSQAFNVPGVDAELLEAARNRIDELDEDDEEWAQF